MDSSAETFGNGASLPLVVGLNCLEDCRFEQEALKGIAIVRHVELSRLAEGGIEKATAVLLHSLAYLPRAAQRLLKGWQIILCLGSTDKAADSVLASDLGLQLLHVDTGRAEEVADTVMALILGLLRHTHVLSKQGMSSSGWLGSLLPLCRGMHRCSGLVLGIIGRSASAFALAARSLAFKMRVLYIDMDQIMYQTMGKSTRHRRSFPAAAKQMDTLNDLLSASDVVSLHCAVTNETPQILNAETLQHIKPGAFIVNASSSHLVDDCVLKQLLIDGTVAGCALDGVEGPQWMEAWVKEMPNVLILPRSADYSEEVWMEIREKAILILHAYFIEGVFPENAVSDDNCDVNSGEDATRGRKAAKEDSHISTQDSEVFDDIRHGSPEYCQKQTSMLPQAHSLQTLDSSMSLESGGYREVRHGRSGKKGKKRSGHHKSQQKTDLSILLGQETNFVALQRDDHGASVSGRDQMISSSSHITSPDAARNKCCLDSTSTVDTSEKQSVISVGPFDQNGDLLKDGLVISMHSKDPKGYHVSRRKSPLGGWILDTIVNITKRDPAAQFLIVCPRKGHIGLRSFAAGGKLLQVNSRGELVFASHNFDAWDSWILEGSTLGACRLINSRNRLVSLDISIEILAAVSEEDGIARWLS